MLRRRVLFQHIPIGMPQNGHPDEEGEGHEWMGKAMRVSGIRATCLSWSFEGVVST